MRILICLIPILLTGCAISEEQKWENEMQHAYDAENAALCMQIYRKAGVPTYHKNHTHSGRKPLRGFQKVWADRDDIMRNRCKAIIPEEMWAD